MSHGDYPLPHPAGAERGELLNFRFGTNRRIMVATFDSRIID
jgi:hypothetical protein